MKIIETQWEFDKDERRYMIEIKMTDDIWNNDTISFYDWEPEDANLWRDFSDCYRILWLLEKAYYAWKRWEEMIIEKKEYDS